MRLLQPHSFPHPHGDFFVSVMPLLEFLLTLFNFFLVLKMLIMLLDLYLEYCLEPYFFLSLPSFSSREKDLPTGRALQVCVVSILFSMTSNVISSPLLPSHGLGCCSSAGMLLHQVFRNTQYFDFWTMNTVFPNQRIWTAVESQSQPGLSGDSGKCCSQKSRQFLLSLTSRIFSVEEFEQFSGIYGSHYTMGWISGSRIS